MCGNWPQKWCRSHCTVDAIRVVGQNMEGRDAVQPKVLVCRLHCLHGRVAAGTERPCAHGMPGREGRCVSSEAEQPTLRRGQARDRQTDTFAPVPIVATITRGRLDVICLVTTASDSFLSGKPAGALRDIAATPGRATCTQTRASRGQLESAQRH